MNLKIKVNNPEESIKAQRAFFRLGFTLDISFEDLDNNGFLKWGGVFGFVAMDGKLTYTSFQNAFDGFVSIKEITLPDLEALAAKAKQPEQQPQETPFERLERVFNEYLVQSIAIPELRNWWRERAGIKTIEIEWKRQN